MSKGRTDHGGKICMELERHKQRSTGEFGCSGAQPICLDGGKSSGWGVCVISNAGLNQSE